MDAGKLDKAQEALEKLCELDKKDRNLRIELAEVCAKAGDKTKAVAILEALAQELNKEKKYKELIKVLLLVFDIEPKRQDVKVRIQKLLTLQERREKRKKRQVTASGGALIIGLLMLIPPIYYEVKARELYAHAERVERICEINNEFTKAKVAYEEVMNSHSLSTQFRKAKRSLERLTEMERQKQASITSKKAAIDKKQEQKLAALRKALPELMKQARKLEEVGDIRKAFDIYLRISTEFAEVPGAGNVPIPILISTTPKGATVEVNGVAQGHTPLVLRAQKGRDLALTLTRSGCEPVQERIQTGKDWRLQYNLNRRPIDELKLSGPIYQPLVLQGNRIYFPSRDGFLYSVTAGRKEMNWQRRLGRFGDLVSDLSSGSEDIIVGNVTGEVTAIAMDSGKARWRGRLGSAVLAQPVISNDGRWVAAASVEGEVVIFDRSTGEAKGKFMAEDEIPGAPAFIKDSLLVGSVDRGLYELSVPQASLVSIIELPATITTGLTVHRTGAIFATSGGTVHRYDAAARKIEWSLSVGGEATGPPVVEGDRAYVGTAGGDLVAIAVRKGAVEWRVKVGKGRVGRLFVGGGRLFAGAESGEVVAVSLTSGAKDWNYQADAAIIGSPLLAFGRLYIPSTTGKILIMEFVE
jgi:tetratricopeptide (TPR) repeat protein